MGTVLPDVAGTQKELIEKVTRTVFRTQDGVEHHTERAAKQYARQKALAQFLDLDERSAVLTRMMDHRTEVMSRMLLGNESVTDAILRVVRSYKVPADNERQLIASLVAAVNKALGSDE